MGEERAATANAARTNDFIVRVVVGLGLETWLVEGIYRRKAGDFSDKAIGSFPRV